MARFSGGTARSISPLIPVSQDSLWLAYPVEEILLFRIATHVGERQDRYRGSVGQRRAARSSSRIFSRVRSVAFCRPVVAIAYRVSRGIDATGQGRIYTIRPRQTEAMRSSLLTAVQHQVNQQVKDLRLYAIEGETCTGRA